jgi:hypothetical protein
VEEGPPPVNVRPEDIEFSDQWLILITSMELNKLLKNLPKERANQIRRRRRTLKNR